MTVTSVRHYVTYKISNVDNNLKDELAQRLEEMANRLWTVERIEDSGIPKAAEEAMEKLIVRRHSCTKRK